jgi:hypothetical protein
MAEPFSTGMRRTPPIAELPRHGDGGRPSLHRTTENESSQEVPVAVLLILGAVAHQCHPAPSRELLHQAQRKLLAMVLNGSAALCRSGHQGIAPFGIRGRTAPTRFCHPGRRIEVARSDRDLASIRHSATPACRAHGIGLPGFEGHQSCD